MALSRLLSLIQPDHCIQESTEHRVVPNTKSYTEPLEEIETKEIKTQTCASSKNTYQHLAGKKSL